MISLTVLFALFANVSFAGNDYLNTNPVVNNTTIVLLAPVTPAEATFDDTTPIADILRFIPVIPSEAGFEEMNADATGSVNLSPSLPEEADFE